MTEKITVRPKIDIPDLSMFGVSNFKENYESFGRHERQVFWETLLKIGFEVASGKGVSGSNYHRLLMMLNTAFPGVDIDRSIFDQMVPNIGMRGPGVTETALAGHSRSSDTRTRDAKLAPTVSSKEPKEVSKPSAKVMPERSEEVSDSERRNDDGEVAEVENSSQKGADVDQTVGSGPGMSESRKNQFRGLIV